MLEEALETGEFVTGKILNKVKGGFAVEVDVVKAFLQVHWLMLAS